ncbi:hypothetical protein FHW36_105465 [Chitinophaga polysaccharea]|uniref:Uncharacterized protein n=1 Tax=Chitinophaga polysaccharea TaxID=1293035 RepID=A0A561PPI1_9BACT|nr:hypothetical protein FHW36_105465 [Chitinophaga polysaccharea]
MDSFFIKDVTFYLTIIFNLFFIPYAKSKAMTSDVLIKVLKTYHLNNSIDHYKGFIPIGQVGECMTTVLNFFPFN